MRVIIDIFAGIGMLAVAWAVIGIAVWVHGRIP